jgi:serine/threonine-protein kinase RsbW
VNADVLTFTSPWHEVIIRSLPEIAPVLDAVVAEMAAQNYPARDIRAVRLVLEEAACNAIKHGNAGDPTRWVWIRYHIDQQSVSVEVEDQGDGFNPDTVPDPCRAENLSRPSGRGLLLMRHYSSWFHIHGRGNRVSFGKVRSAVADAPAMAFRPSDLAA